MSFKIFDKWECKKIEIRDRGLREQISLNERTMPYTFGIYSNKQFGKRKVNLVERLANKLNVTGHIKDTRVHKRSSGRDTGKKQRSMRIVKKALEKIERKTKKNPMQLLVNAVENCAPIEETTRIRQGGIIVHKAVDVAPERRLNLSLSFIAHGAGQRAFKKKQSIDSALAEEIVAAANYDVKTYSVSKKEELERVATSAR